MNSKTASNAAGFWPLECPNKPLDKSLSGWVRFTRLNKLKMSALNSREKAFPLHYLGEFCIDIGENRGPVNVFRPTLPSCPSAGDGNAEADAKPFREIGGGEPVCMVPGGRARWAGRNHNRRR